MIFTIKHSNNDPRIDVISSQNIDNIDIIIRDKITRLSFLSYHNMAFVEGSSIWFAYPAIFDTSGLIIEISKNGEPLETHNVSLGDKNYPTSFTINSDDNSHSWFGYKEIFLLEQYGDVKGFNTAVDIGANIGLFSIYCHVNGVSRIIAVEPDRHNITYLEENRKIITGDKGWQIVRGAVGYADGYQKFCEYGNGNSSSLFEKEIDPDSVYDVRTYNINTILSQVSGDIDILKLDCEGAEFPVFRTINDYNMSRIRNVACEIHEAKYRCKDEIMDKLNACGFDIKVVSPMYDSIMTIYASRI